MENKYPMPKVPAQIHFIPNGPIDSAARKAIRSHVTLDIRRRQRQQKLLNLQTRPLRPKNVFLEENICRCFVLIPQAQSAQPGSKTLKSKSAIQRQQSADSYKNCPRCRGVQFSALSEQGKLKSAKSYPSVVALLQSGLDPFNTVPEVPNLSPAGNQMISEIKAHCKLNDRPQFLLLAVTHQASFKDPDGTPNTVITFMSPGLLKTSLLSAANQSSALMMAILFLSCLNLAAMRDTPDERMEILGNMIKKETLHQINKLLSNEETARETATISAIGWLSAGVWCLGEPTALEEVNAHEQGLSSLVHLGPTWEPGEDDPLGRSLVKLLVLHKYVRSAMTGAPIEEYIRLKYQRCPPISESDFFAESPLFCPLGDFHNVRRARDGSERMIQLLHAAKRLIDSTLELDPMIEGDREINIQRHKLAKAEADEILVSKEGDTMHVDYLYECCRLATLLMIQALEKGIPFGDLDNSFADQLKSALQKTDIGNVWGPMSGVLWWVCLVGDSIATVGAPQHRYIDTVLRQTMHELVYKTPLFEATTIATAKFAKFKSLTGIPAK